MSLDTNFTLIDRFFTLCKQSQDCSGLIQNFIEANPTFNIHSLEPMTNDNGFTSACRTGSKLTIRYLKDKLKLNIYHRNKFGNDGLQQAILGNNVNIIEYLLENRMLTKDEINFIRKVIPIVKPNSKYKKSFLHSLADFSDRLPNKQNHKLEQFYLIRILTNYFIFDIQEIILDYLIE